MVVVKSVWTAVAKVASKKESFAQRVNKVSSFILRTKPAQNVRQLIIT